jgi:hypothetical protein
MLKSYRVTEFQGYKVAGLQGNRVIELKGYRVNGPKDLVLIIR